VLAKAESEKHYQSAADFLELVLEPKDVARMLAALRRARTVTKKAKDIARASGLEILPGTDRDVAKHIDRLRAGDAIAPLLVVRGRLDKRAPLTIADGYHRPRAIYHLNEEAEVPCKIADL
jgi:hypothetical protein